VQKHPFIWNFTREGTSPHAKHKLNRAQSHPVATELMDEEACSISKGAAVSRVASPSSVGSKGHCQPINTSRLFIVNNGGGEDEYYDMVWYGMVWYHMVLA
jgi:hypothetical protein